MANMRLKKTVLEVVDNQLRDNNPPITRETLKRIMDEGAPESLAKEWIAAAMPGEIYDVMKDKVPFDEVSYARNLRALHYESKGDS